MTPGEHTPASITPIADARLGARRWSPVDSAQDFDEAVWELEYGLRNPAAQTTTFV